jgi:uncharacterized protein involved in exopolysaccharide biosynthesis
MSSASSAPARQPLPDLPEHEIPDTNPEQSPTPQAESVFYLRQVWDRRRLLPRGALFGLVAGTILAFLIRPTYDSTARLMPPDNHQSAGLAAAAAALSGGAGLGGIATEVLGMRSTSDIFVGILSSRTVQDNLVQQFGLRRLYGGADMSDARAELARHTSISVDRKSQIISITVSDHNPRRAAAIGQAYVEELNRLVVDLSTSSARRERIFLEERLQAVSRDLEAAEQAFSQFASRNTAIDVKEQGKAMVEAAATLQGQVIAAQSQYEGLREIYTDSSPRVRAAKARIDELQRQLEKLGGKDESSSGDSDTTGKALYPSIRKLPLLGVTYADLYRRTKIQEAVLEALTKEYEMAKVQEAKEIPTVKVLDAATVPDKKAFPPRLLIMVLGMVLGLTATTAWVVANTTWNRTDSNDERKIFALELIGALRAGFPGLASNGDGNHLKHGRFGNWVRWRRIANRGEAHLE